VARPAATLHEEYDADTNGCPHRVSNRARMPSLLLDWAAHSCKATDPSRIQTSYKNTSSRDPNAPGSDLASRGRAAPQAGRSQMSSTAPLHGAQSRYTARILLTHASRARTGAAPAAGSAPIQPPADKSDICKHDILANKDHTDAEGAPDSRCAGMPADATRLTGPRASSDIFSLFGACYRSLLS
jgi:hypothetical protein